MIQLGQTLSGESLKVTEPFRMSETHAPVNLEAHKHPCQELPIKAVWQGTAGSIQELRMVSGRQLSRKQGPQSYNGILSTI